MPERGVHSERMPTCCHAISPSLLAQEVVARLRAQEDRADGARVDVGADDVRLARAVDREGGVAVGAQVAVAQVDAGVGAEPVADVLVEAEDVLGGVVAVEALAEVAVGVEGQPLGPRGVLAVAEGEARCARCGLRGGRRRTRRRRARCGRGRRLPRRGPGGGASRW